jgi:hypothetical protein
MNIGVSYTKADTLSYTSRTGLCFFIHFRMPLVCGAYLQLI